MHLLGTATTAGALSASVLHALVVGILAARPACAASPQPPDVSAPRPHYPIPSERQLAWHDCEMYGFVHFTINTFTDLEWGSGSESPSLFNPTELDCRQWVSAAKAAGMKGLILTAKHHDGFCLWPTEYTDHSVKRSPWRGGEGDLLREMSDACREAGLKLGVYLSPWDRNHAEYGREEYVEYYQRQLREVLSNYGDVFVVWHDGANGGDGFYGGANETRRIDRRTYYRYPEIYAITRELQPDAVIFSDAGPDIRWIGNEEGRAPETCWAKIDPNGLFPGEADRTRLAHGDADGTVWRPAEVDVSIRKGWFFHPDEEAKSLKELLEIYYQSVGRGCCLNLNITPDRRGLVPEPDVQRLVELRETLDQTFETDLAEGRPVSATDVRGDAFAPENLTDADPATYWATSDETRSAEVVIGLEEDTVFNRLLVAEHIPLGQRVESFCVDAYQDGVWREVATGTTIGARRILVLPEIEADKLRIRVLQSQACPLLSRVSLYRATTEPRLFE